jgi:hypothetical protein
VRYRGMSIISTTDARTETKSEKKERLAVEAEAAWAEYRAKQEAVDINMERLRAQRLAREAQLSKVPPSPKKRSRAAA